LFRYCLYVPSREGNTRANKLHGIRGKYERKGLFLL